MDRQNTLPLLLTIALTTGCRSQPAETAGITTPTLASTSLLDEDFGRRPTANPPESRAQGVASEAELSGVIVLPPARRPSVAQGDTIFIVARRPGGFPGASSLLAVQRLAAGEWPLRFSLGAHDAMGAAFRAATSVDLTVRVDKDGDPMTRQRGDLYGRVDGVSVGSRDVVVTLDSLQTEDRTLSAGPATRGGDDLPPGHP